MKKKILIILIGILLYVTVIVIELCYIYATQGDNTWNYLSAGKEKIQSVLQSGGKIF